MESTTEDRSDLTQTDHDKLVEVSARVSWIDKEVDSLRAWRHDAAAPVMMQIQAQQRENAQAIGKLAETTNILAAGFKALEGLPDALRTHLDQDEKALSALRDGLSGLDEKISKKHLSIILWLSGIMMAVAGGVIGMQWLLISPHIVIK